MVRAWIADVTPLMEEEIYQTYYQVLPDFRKEKADALKHAAMKAQSVGAWTLLEKIRARYSLPESSAFNLSHSGDYVMCAAQTGEEEGRCKVGCDLEKIAKPRIALAKHFFCPEEYEDILHRETEEEQTERFYRYWVLKESFMKATRKGMALPLDSFCIRLGNPSVLVRKPEEYRETYYYMEYEVEGLPYRMAVCSTDRKIDMKIYTELEL